MSIKMHNFSFKSENMTHDKYSIFSFTMLQEENRGWKKVFIWFRRRVRTFSRMSKAINPFCYFQFLSASCAQDSSVFPRHVYVIMNASKWIHQFRINAQKGVEKWDWNLDQILPSKKLDWKVDVIMMNKWSILIFPSMCNLRTSLDRTKWRFMRNWRVKEPKEKTS